MSKPTLIFLPALPCGADFYAAQTDALSDLVDCQVMVLEEPTLAESAAMVLASAPPRFLLAGTAYGGCLAIEIAVTAPERIAGLWLMNCSPGANPDPERARRTAARARAGDLVGVLKDWGEFIVAENNTAAREQFVSMARAAGPERFAAQYEASAGRADHWQDLQRITAPTLLLWGEDDHFVPVAIGRRMAEVMLHSELVTLPGCRHFPALEQPAETTAAARDWLRAVLASST